MTGSKAASIKQPRHYVAGPLRRIRLDSSFWNSRYSSAEFLYGETPNEFLMDMETLLPNSSRILVPGDGEGRNGVWLAQRGHSVTTVDSSELGVQKAKDLARRRSVQLDMHCADLLTWVYPSSEFDAAVLIYLHLPTSIREEIHRKIAKSIKPGGILLVECFHPKQLAYSSGGPKNHSMLYTEQMLREDFADLMVPHFEFEGEVQLEEGSGHSGLAQVTRWLAGRAGCIHFQPRQKTATVHDLPHVCRT